METIATLFARLFSKPEFVKGDVVIHGREEYPPEIGIVKCAHFVRPNDSKKWMWVYNLTIIRSDALEIVRVLTYASAVPENHLQPVCM